MSASEMPDDLKMMRAVYRKLGHLSAGDQDLEIFSGEKTAYLS